MSSLPFNPWMAGADILGGAVADAGSGVYNYFDTRRMLEDRALKQKEQAQLMKQREQQMRIQDAQENRSAETYMRGLDTTKANEQHKYMVGLMSRGKIGDAYNLFDDFAKSYGAATGVQLSGPRLHERKEVQQRPSNEYGQMQGPMPMVNVPGSVDDKNPANYRAMAASLALPMPQTQYKPTDNGIMAFTPSELPGGAPTNTFYPDPIQANKPAKFDASRYNVDHQNGVIIDLSNGTVTRYANPTDSTDVKAQRLELAIQTLMANSTDKNADNLRQWEADKRSAYDQAYRRVFAIDEDPVAADKAGKEAAAAVPQPQAVPVPGNAFNNPFPQPGSGGGATGLTPQTSQRLQGFQSVFPGAKITSTYRDPAHDASVGGVGGFHTTGEAWDAVNLGGPGTLEGQKVQAWAKQQGLEAIYHNAGSGYHWHFEPPGKPKARGGTSRATALAGGATQTGKPNKAQTVTPAPKSGPRGKTGRAVNLAQ